MAWLIYSRNKNGSRSNTKNLIAGMIVLLLLGIGMFFLFNGLDPFRFSFPIILWIIGFAVFFIVIIGIGTAAAVMSKNYKMPSGAMNYRYGTQRRIDFTNPYIVKDSKFNQGEKPTLLESEKSDPEIEIENFCRYCGAKRDRVANFCYQCGGKL